MRRQLLLLLLLALPVTAWAQTPPTGFSNLTGPDWIQSGGVATAGATFGYTRWTTAYGANQQAGCILSALPNEGETLHILFRFENLSNRIRLILTRVAGTDNDTLTLGEIVDGATNTLQGPISLGKDIQVNDRVGIEVTSNAINGNYWSVDPAWAEWKTVVTGTATRTPAASYIGLGGAAPVACTQFFGQGDSVAGDITPPLPDPPTGVTATTVTESSIVLAADPCTDETSFLGYTYYRCDGTASPGCTPTVAIATVPSLPFADTGLTANTNYRYRLKCTDGPNVSVSFSTPVVNATTLATADAQAPTTPGALTVTLGPRVVDPAALPAITLTLAAPSTDNINVVGYPVQMGTQSNCADCVEICRIASFAEFPITVSGGDNASCVTTIPYGVTRYFRVRATDAIGNMSAFTSVVGITTPVTYHTAAPARPTVVAKPTVIQKPDIVDEPPVP